MVIDLTTLPADRVPVVAEMPAAALDVPPEDFVVHGPVRFEGDIVAGAGASYELTGRLQAKLGLPCARCAESFDFSLDVPVQLRFVPEAAEKAGVRAPASADDDTDDGREMDDDDPSIVTYDEPRIDLAPVAREQCYLAIPMKPLCRPDCQGLCPQCGTNRNTGTCTCENQWEDPRLAGLKSLLQGADRHAPRE
jgi:uncharacterized protein